MSAAAPIRRVEFNSEWRLTDQDVLRCKPGPAIELAGRAPVLPYDVLRDPHEGQADHADHDQHQERRTHAQQDDERRQMQDHERV